MSNSYQYWSSRQLRRRRDRQVWQSGIETLERRDCPAVVFEFTAGVLSVIGDSAPNVLELTQQDDQVVVTADGLRQQFKRVDRVIIDSGDGADDIQVHLNPQELPAGKSVPWEVATGSGNDRLLIDDGRALNTRDWPHKSLGLQIDLGAGTDALRVALNNHHDVSLDVFSADGGDTIEAPIAIVICQHTDGTSFPCGFRSSVQLGGDDNSVNLRVQNAHDVDVDLSLSGGDNQVAIGLLLPAVQKIREAAVKMSVALGGDGNLVSAGAIGFDAVELVGIDYRPTPGGEVIPLASARFQNSTDSPRASRSIPTGTVTFIVDGVSTSANSEDITIRARGYDLNSVDANLPGSNDSIWIDIDAPVGAKLTGQLNLGAGSDNLKMTTRNVDQLDLSIAAGSGDDTIAVFSNWSNSEGRYLTLRPRSVDQDLAIDAGEGNDCVFYKPLFAFSVEDLDGARLNIQSLLGAGNDRLEIDTAGFADVNTLVDAGAGDDAVNVRHRMFALVDRTRLNVVVMLGAGSDSLVLDTQGYREIHTVVATGPAGDGRDSVSASHQSLRRSGRVQRSRQVLDGKRDVYEQRTLGYAVELIDSTIVAFEYLLLG